MEIVCDIRQERPQRRFITLDSSNCGLSTIKSYHGPRLSKLTDHHSSYNLHQVCYCHAVSVIEWLEQRELVDRYIDVW